MALSLLYSLSRLSVRRPLIVADNRELFRQLFEAVAVYHHFRTEHQTSTMKLYLAVALMVLLAAVAVNARPGRHERHRGGDGERRPKPGDHTEDPLGTEPDDHTGKPDDDIDDRRRHGPGRGRGGKRRWRKHPHKSEDHTADPREPEDHTRGPPDGRGDSPEGFRPELFSGQGRVPRDGRQKGPEDHTASPDKEDHTGRFEDREDDEESGRRGREGGHGRRQRGGW